MGNVPGELPPVMVDDAAAEIWEVCSPEDAGALMSGCPMESVICCSFSVAYADGMEAQSKALRELAAAQPAGLVFASVDMKESPEVATWAGATKPGCRLV